MNRREMLKLTSVTLGALTVPGRTATADDKNSHNAVPLWEVFELTLEGPTGGNPFTDIQLTANFSLGSRTIAVDGFYDGGGKYKIRFMPDTEGRWSYITASNSPALAEMGGSFECSPSLKEAHGLVRVRNTHHFAYADGTPFFPFGTTCYAWVHQSEELQRETLESLRNSPFNKIRMCIFPKSYEYNHNEPLLYPFERDANGRHDFTRPNPAYFSHIEQRVSDLRAIGVEADLILFHPYDRWGYATMTPDQDDQYLRYVLARMSAYRNIWWSMANEFDLMRAKNVQDFDRLFHIVEKHDPVGHLRSIHYSRVMYDYGQSWVSHASLQTAQFEKAGEWLKTWDKPIVFDEVQYEGNLNRRWGNISGEEMTRRFWLGVIAGCYVTHGETYLDPNQPFDESATPTLWWSHGGKLHGTSPARIGYLRKLVENTANVAGKDASRTGLESSQADYYPNASSFDQEGKVHEEILYYMDYHQPIYYEFPLPEGQFTAEMIDPWEMKATSLSGTFSGKSKIRLSGKPFQALRFRRIS